MLRNRQEDLLNFCRRYGVLLHSKVTKRHYLLANGEHTDEFFHFASGFQDAEFRRIIATEIMEELGNLGLLNQNDDDENNIGIILVPALGGILLGGTLQHLFYGKKPVLVYAEKNHEKKLELRRGFYFPKNKGILIVDDAYTSGKTFAELEEICDKHDSGGAVLAKVAVVNRNPSGLPKAEHIIMIPHCFLIRYPIHSFPVEQCPYEGVYPLEKDGTLVDNHGDPLQGGKVVEG